MELAVGIAAACYKNDFESALKESLKNSMTNYSAIESEKVAWNNIQTKVRYISSYETINTSRQIFILYIIFQLKCCGIDGPADWQAQTIPLTCCQDVSENDEAQSSHCSQAPNNAYYLRTTGCFEKLQMKANSNAKVLVGVGIGIAFVEVKKAFGP